MSHVQPSHSLRSSDVGYRSKGCSYAQYSSQVYLRCQPSLGNAISDTFLGFLSLFPAAFCDARPGCSLHPSGSQSERRLGERSSRSEYHMWSTLRYQSWGRAARVLGVPTFCFETYVKTCIASRVVSSFRHVSPIAPLEGSTDSGIINRVYQLRTIYGMKV